MKMKRAAIDAAVDGMIDAGLKLTRAEASQKIYRVYDRAGIEYQHVFDPVVAYEDTGERKPSPKPFARALELLNVRPSQAIMVGDWPERDVVGAAKLGIRTAFARYGDTFGTEHSGADYDLNDVYDLVEIVDR